MITLDVHDGSQRRPVTVDSDVVRIGRDPDCEVQLPGDSTVSRVHAVLTAADGGWVIADHGSRNGTFVNGRKLVAETPQRLEPTDRILVGQFVLVLQNEHDRFVETAAAGDSGATRAQVESGLSAREIEVLRLVCAGDTDKQIAESLFISVKTVHSHLERIRDKTGCRRRAELMRFAVDHGLA